MIVLDPIRDPRSRRDAFGWPHELGNDQIGERLLAPNAARDAESVGIE